MTMMEHAKVGLQNIMRRVAVLTPSSLFGTLQGASSKNVGTFTKLKEPIGKNTPIRLGNLKEQEGRLGDLINLKESVLTDLQITREDLSYLKSRLTMRYISLSKEFGGKGLPRIFGLDEGIYNENNDDDHMRRQFKYLTRADGKFLNMLVLVNDEIRNLCWEMNREQIQIVQDFEHNKEVEQRSREENLALFPALREATQYFALREYLFEGHHSIMHDSSKDEVLKTLGEMLTTKFPYLRKSALKCGVDDHIGRLKLIHWEELVREFCLFLPTCKFIEYDYETIDDNIALIKKDEEFQKKFSELPEHYFLRGFHFYGRYMQCENSTDECEWRSNYVKVVEENFDPEKNVTKVHNPYGNKIYEMVFQTRKKGHRLDIHADPLTEVKELVRCYEAIKSATTANSNGDSL